MTQVRDYAQVRTDIVNRFRSHNYSAMLGSILVLSEMVYKLSNGQEDKLSIHAAALSRLMNATVQSVKDGQMNGIEAFFLTETSFDAFMIDAFYPYMKETYEHDSFNRVNSLEHMIVMGTA